MTKPDWRTCSSQMLYRIAQWAMMRGLEAQSVQVGNLRAVQVFIGMEVSTKGIGTGKQITRALVVRAGQAQGLDQVFETGTGKLIATEEYAVEGKLMIFAETINVVVIEDLVYELHLTH